MAHTKQALEHIKQLGEIQATNLATVTELSTVLTSALGSQLLDVQQECVALRRTLANVMGALALEVAPETDDGTREVAILSAIGALRKDHARKDARIKALEGERAQHPCTFVFDYDGEGRRVGDVCVACGQKRV